MAKGWIKIYRSITDHWVYQDNLRFKAWMDLLLRANHKSKRVRFNKGFIDVKKGQTVTSLQKLADAWLCSRDTVSNILKEFENDGMITVDSDNHRTLVTIVKYSVFQGVSDTDSDADSATDYDANYDANSAADSTQTRMIKNDIRMINNDQRTKEPAPPESFDLDGRGFVIEE